MQVRTLIALFFTLLAVSLASAHSSDRWSTYSGDHYSDVWYDDTNTVHVYRHHFHNVFVEASPHRYPYRTTYAQRVCSYSRDRWRCRY